MYGKQPWTVLIAALLILYYHAWDYLCGFSDLIHTHVCHLQTLTGPSLLCDGVCQWRGSHVSYPEVQEVWWAQSSVLHCRDHVCSHVPTQQRHHLQVRVKHKTCAKQTANTQNVHFRYALKKNPTPGLLKTHLVSSLTYKSHDFFFHICWSLRLSWICLSKLSWVFH